MEPEFEWGPAHLREEAQPHTTMLLDGADLPEDN